MDDVHVGLARCFETEKKHFLCKESVGPEVEIGTTGLELLADDEEMTGVGTCPANENSAVAAAF